MTAPLGYLKRNKTLINPPLPVRLSQAIDNIGYGCLEKVWITFLCAFWVDFPGETLFLAPEYAQNTNPHCWNQEMVSLASLPEPYARPTVIFYVYGKCAQESTSRITGVPQESLEYYNTLNAFFEPYYSRLPGFSKSSVDCVPKAFLSTDWQHDR